MDIYQNVDLFSCPGCGGTAMLENENGMSWYVICQDCACHTVDVEYKTEAEKLQAAKTAAHLWNIGKVISYNPGE